jgi:Fe-S cluster assembly protein SufD
MESPLFPVDVAGALPGPPWLKQFRKDAVNKLGSMSLPSTSEEIWRYSRVDDIDLSLYKPPSDTGKIDSDLQKQIDVLADVGGPRIVTIDGQFSKELSDELEGVRVCSVSDYDEAVVVGPRDDAFIVANDAFSTGLVIDVPNNSHIDEPILVLNVVAETDAMSFPRTVIRVGESASVSIIESFLSASVNALTVPVAEIEVGENAQLHHIVLQNLASTVVSIARQTSRLARDARLSSANLVFGGDFARVRNDTELIGDGSASNLSAVYFGENKQMLDFRTLQEHVGKHTTSDLFFRGAVGDSAHAVYSGLIRIRKGAHGTDAMQSNRTLKLSSDAIADSVPNLEIDENDVRCAHASAVGPIGEEERYYLESRGIRPEEADRLIVLGFLDQVFARIPTPGIVDYAREILRRKWEAHA